eukprot:CAMPEP_0202356432 /NCGR_PEP_ID=MMETSP1126-20121109/10898_1 /ASSEMBLY_ACC=CAM_ASM_000457 /TAXON_ID=3047 /ORGANISM="Dunaliella tertiolecta, Strain CCMP1320" /LENGTH=32 /DNA_ID= /DNA_START= /DNA_END= /DNA_ORIENTATION=
MPLVPHHHTALRCSPTNAETCAGAPPVLQPPS